MSGECSGYLDLSLYFLLLVAMHSDEVLTSDSVTVTVLACRVVGWLIAGLVVSWPSLQTGIIGVVLIGCVSVCDWACLVRFMGCQSRNPPTCLSGRLSFPSVSLDWDCFCYSGWCCLRKCY